MPSHHTANDRYSSRSSAAENSATARPSAGAGLERHPPRHVGQPGAQVVRDVFGRQALQAVEVQVAHPVIAEQADEVRDHAAVRKQPLVGPVAVSDLSCHGGTVRRQTA